MSHFQFEGSYKSVRYPTSPKGYLKKRVPYTLVRILNLKNVIYVGEANPSRVFLELSAQAWSGNILILQRPDYMSQESPQFQTDHGM
jgi:hypothetical protein